MAGRPGAPRYRNRRGGHRLRHDLAQGRHLIREATVTDLPDILAIYNHYVLHSTATFDEEPMELDALRAKFEHIAAAGLPFLVVETDGVVAGFAYAAPWRQKAAYRYTAETTIYLAPAATGAGTGSRLLAELLERASAAGLRQLIAVIADHGAEASIALHERFGYIRVGRLDRVGFKFGRWLGTVLMQKSLTPA